MTYLGYLLYPLTGLIVWLMWRQARGKTFDDLLDKSAQKHKQVHEVFAEHPDGGSWKRFQQWMKERDI
ncbi:MAG: hypothetical protein OEU36_04650 [Gammaproteobacteria bacterium]|nr:hypothetical protein [Gammaproteobacteria bacterium]